MNIYIRLNLKKLILLSTIFFQFFNVESQIWSNDPSFNTGGTGATYYNGTMVGSVVMAVPLSNGQIIVAGGFTEFNAVNRYGIARLNADGSLDLSYQMADTIYAQLIVIDSLDRMILCQQGTIERYLSDGQIDVTFNTSTLQLSGQVQDMYLQPDGKILVAGSINYMNSNSVIINSIMRLNADGSVDPTFNPPAAIDIFSVEAIKIQSDGKIIVGGNFNSFAGSGYNNLMRFESNGLIDYTFNNSNLGPDGFINDLYIDSTDKIIIGGNITTYNGLTCDQIIRLNTNGDLDPTFNLDMPILSASNSPFYSLVPLSSGKVMIVGDSYSPGPNVVRMNENGEIDTTFILYSGGNDAVTNCFEQPDGNIVVCGLFSTFGSISKRGITRLSSICGEIHTSEYVTTLTSYSWPVNGATYTASGQYSSALTGVNGCDSLITLNLVIDSIFLNTVVAPTPDLLCTGALYASATGNPGFQYALNGLPPTTTEIDYVVFDNLCDGFYELVTVDALLDTLYTTILIPSLDNFFSYNLYPDSSIVDSMGTIINNCGLFELGNLDSVYIQDLYIVGNTLFVTWYIHNDSTLNIITTNYFLDSVMNGVYTIQLSAICQQKSIADYFVVNESIYIDQNNILLSIPEPLSKSQFIIYPNPFDNIVHVSFDGVIADLTIFDASGQILYNQVVSDGEIIDLNNLDKGVYFVVLQTEQGSEFNRLIKK